MSQSPYSPPRADLGTAADALPTGTGDFDFGRCLSEAWADTWANFPLWLGVLIVWTLATLVAALTVIGIFLVVPVLAWGMFLFFLKMRDGGAQFGDAFSGFSRYGAALGPILVFSFVSILIGLPGQILTQVGSIQQRWMLYAVGLVLSLVVAFLVNPRLSFAPFLIVERGLGGVEALRSSWGLTDRVKWKLIGLVLLSGVVVTAGLLAFIVGVIPASVMAYLMIVSAYRQVVGGTRPA